MLLATRKSSRELGPGIRRDDVGGVIAETGKQVPRLLLGMTESRAGRRA